MKPRTTTHRGITYRQENRFFFERVPEDEYHPLYGWILIGLAIVAWIAVIGIGYAVFNIVEAIF